MKANKILLFSSLGILANLLGCGGGGGSGGAASGGSPGSNFGCDGGCAVQTLTASDVTLIVQQAATAANQLGTPGTFAVVDRVGNVLALYRMSGAPATTVINGQRGASGGLENLSVPATLAAISKAGTGAYLSSQGNAFSTRTASQIIQEHFLPGQNNQPGGPLFGVQFSQLVCSDVTVEGQGSAGPHALPLGLSADPGGFPLYKDGDLVGGVGVEFDGLYTLDPNVSDTDDLPEERVALMATKGFEAPSERVGDNISLAGRTARYSDISYSSLGLSADLIELDGGGFIAQRGFSSGGVRSGLSGNSLPGRSGARGGRALANGEQLQPLEVSAILDSAIATADRTRAAIRTPRDTPARVSIFVVDDRGSVLGFVRSQDAPVFGIDVALQKARTAALFSSTDAASVMIASGLSGYVSAFSQVTGRALDGSIAMTSRAVGNLARPFLPDGIENTGNGPFSKPYSGLWSIFNTGVQLDLIFAGLASPVLNPGSQPSGCAGGALGNRARNGIQIFAGGVPLYRGTTLIGAIGVSGDGIDQDDMVAFYGASRRGLDYVGHSGIGDSLLGYNAPKEMRIDAVDLPEPQLRIRYVQCPEGPFLMNNEQGVCG